MILKKLSGNYLLKAFMNVGGKCSKKQRKSHCMEQTHGDGKATNGHIYERNDEEKEEGNFDEEPK